MFRKNRHRVRPLPPPIAASKATCVFDAFAPSGLGTSAFAPLPAALAFSVSLKPDMTATSIRGLMHITSSRFNDSKQAASQVIGVYPRSS
eukprot:CAMPEP_0185768878 /NCGR_PEP_ID=MMETSP1174-20130828/52790_1 /TAXON_ID=35687 /ORGANISM="Dictyocha speculum, Strain CCMP1381" /LENGTH=89 /DNA_ID=CAMNT_0028453771 /DNA_START=226 /DNA_END=491 /DNA_ORIENTATION=-